MGIRAMLRDFQMNISSFHLACKQLATFDAIGAARQAFCDESLLHELGIATIRSIGLLGT